MYIKSICHSLKLIKAPKKADLLSNYINSLDERNKQAYEIARC